MQILERFYVLDTSVIVKWFSNEENTDIALNFRDKFINGNIKIIAPDLLLYELSNALRYNKSFNEEDVKNAIKSIIDMDIEILTPFSEAIDLSVEIAFKYNATYYDAYYIAMAQALNIDFVTADSRLFNKCKKDLLFVKLLKEFE